MKSDQFSSDYHGKPVHYLILNLEGGLFVWMGDDHFDVSTLALGLMTKYSPMATSTTLMGYTVHDRAGQISQRLASILKLQVFVSYNLPEEDSELYLYAEKQLMEKLRAMNLPEQLPIGR